MIWRIRLILLIRYIRFDKSIRLIRYMYSILSFDLIDLIDSIRLIWFIYTCWPVVAPGIGGDNMYDWGVEAYCKILIDKFDLIDLMIWLIDRFIDKPANSTGSRSRSPLSSCIRSSAWKFENMNIKFFSNKNAETRKNVETSKKIWEQTCLWPSKYRGIPYSLYWIHYYLRWIRFYGEKWFHPWLLSSPCFFASYLSIFKYLITIF